MASNFALSTSGLTTASLSFTEARIINAAVKVQVPTVSEGAPSASAVVTTISQNSSVIYTGKPGSDGASIYVSVLPNDIISFNFSSSAPIDQTYNAVKATISIG